MLTRFALQPRWWALHLALVVVLVSFGWLGWWQLQSFQRQSAPAAGSAEVVPLDRISVPGGRIGADDTGRRVRAEGTWESEDQLVVPGRERGGRTGSLVLTTLRTADGLLPVVRGWVQSEAAPPVAAGRVTVTGILQQSETEADATVGPGGLTEGQVGYVATVTLLERLPYDPDDLYDGYVVLRSQQPPDATAPEAVGASRTHDGGGGPARWRNLAYALQWWLFAGAAVFFWGSVLRRAAQEQARPPERGAGPGPLVAPRRRT